MKRSSSAPCFADARAGFTLLEALVSLAIAGAILSGIAMLAAQVLRNWDRGHNAIAAMEMLTSGLGRLGADLSSALPMRPPGSEDAKLLFKGGETSMMFVAATGWGAGNKGVELISLEVVPDPDGIALLRKRGPVASLGASQSDPVALLRGRVKVAFSYRGEDGAKTTEWADQDKLPVSVEVEIRGASGAPIFPVASVFPLPSRLAVECLKAAAATTTAAKKDAGSESACGGAGTADGDSDDENEGTGNDQGTAVAPGGKAAPPKPGAKASQRGEQGGGRLASSAAFADPRRGE